MSISLFFQKSGFWFVKFYHIIQTFQNMATYDDISVSFFIPFHFTEMSFHHIAWYWLLVLICCLTKAFVFTIKDLMKKEDLPDAVAKIPATQ